MTGWRAWIDWVALSDFRRARAEFYRDFAEMYQRNEAMVSFLEGEIANASLTRQRSRARALRLVLHRHQDGDHASRVSHLLEGVVPRSDGLLLALNIGAMLIAFIGLIAMLNGGLQAIHATRFFGWLPDSMQGILGRIFAPIAWLLGVKWNDCATVGNLLGTRLILNEFVAFVDLGKIGSGLDPKSFVIATYALCGFANLSSVAMQVGGIGALAPTRRSDLARLGMKAVAAGTLANTNIVSATLR